MVICNYFLNGNCRFGTKCMNDHVDLKQVIKTEVESCVSSNQWPLSCFGPFKEKPSLDNFIEDQSFEEVRYYCFEAKNGNTLPQFTMQLAEKIKDAKNKMQSLMMMTPEIVQEIVKIYNSGPASKANTPAASSSAFGAATASNPFMSTAGSASTAASIFGGATQSTFGSGAPVASIFGQASQQSAAFGAKPNIFGQQPQQQQQTSSIFGTPQQQTVGFAQAPTSSIFGGATQQPAAPSSIFGTAPAQTTFGAAPSIFGGSQNVNTGGGGSIFAPAPTAPANQFAQPPTNSVFGNAPQAAPFQAPANQSPFGGAMQPAQPQPAFGATSVFTATPTPTNTWQNNNQATGSPFGATPAVQQPQTAAEPAPSTLIYSKMENLTAEQLNAFQAENFTIGQIPNVPPPKELCS